MDFFLNVLISPLLFLGSTRSKTKDLKSSQLFETWKIIMEANRGCNFPLLLAQSSATRHTNIKHDALKGKK